MTGNIVNDAANWMSNFFVEITDFLIKKESALKPYLVISENVVNAIKKAESSPEGKFVTTIIEAVVPSSTCLIEALKLQLPIWMVSLNWAINEAGKTSEEQFNDGVVYLKSIKDADIYAVQLNSLKALVSKFFAGNNALELTIQQALTIAQPDHKAAVLLLK